MRAMLSLWHIERREHIVSVVPSASVFYLSRDASKQRSYKKSLEGCRHNQNYETHLGHCLNS